MERWLKAREEEQKKGDYHHLPALRELGLLLSVLRTSLLIEEREKMDSLSMIWRDVRD
jgi:hypothetical protein